MAGYYSNLTDKQLADKIKKFQKMLITPKASHKVYITRLKFLEKEKNDRLRKSIMSISNLLNKNHCKL